MLYLISFVQTAFSLVGLGFSGKYIDPGLAWILLCKILCFLCFRLLS